MTSRLVCGILMVAAVLVMPTSSWATMWTVAPGGFGDFLTITSALTDLSVMDGDTIKVVPGTYLEKLTIGKAVSLTSIGGPSVTTIDAGGLGTVLDISKGATVDGFTITGGSGDFLYGGIHVTSTDLVTITNNVITGNVPTSDLGLPVGGIFVDVGAKALIRGNDIHSNAALSVGGIFVPAGASADVIGNKIRGNGSSGPIAASIGGILYGGTGTIANNQITGNKATGTAGVSLEGADVTLVNNTISGNFGSVVGGVTLTFASTDATITNTIIHGNEGGTIKDLAGTASFLGGGYLTMSYSHVGFIGAGLPPGLFMVSPFLPPLFVAPESAGLLGPTILGDFHLLAASPDIDKGLDAAAIAAGLTTDLDGSPRFAGSAVDIGAYEFQTTAAIPEPNVLTLLTIGIVGIGIFGWRRWKRVA